MKTYRIVRYGSTNHLYSVQRKWCGIWWTGKTHLYMDEAKRLVRNKLSPVVEVFSNKA